MNNSRRKEIDAVIVLVEALAPKAADIRELIEAFKEDCADLVTTIQEIRADEEEAFDALPEGLQAGERGQDMEEAMSQLDEAMCHLGEGDEINFEDWSPDEAVQALDAAKGAS